LVAVLLRSTCTRLKLPSDFRVHLLRHEPQRRDHATGRSLTVQWIRRDSRGRPPQSARVAGARRERQAFCPSLLSPAGGRALGRCVSPGDSFLSHFCASFLEPPSFFLSSSLVSTAVAGFVFFAGLLLRPGPVSLPAPRVPAALACCRCVLGCCAGSSPSRGRPRASAGCRG